MPYCIRIACLPLKQTTVLEVVFDNNIGDCIKDKLYIVGISSTCKMGVDLFSISLLVQVLKLKLDIGRCFLVGIWTWNNLMYSKAGLKRPLKNKTKIVFKNDYAGRKYCRLLQGEHSAILKTFIKLPSIIKIFVLSIFEWPPTTGFNIMTYHIQPYKRTCSYKCTLITLWVVANIWTSDFNSIQVKFHY